NGILYFNTSCAGDALRGSGCSRNTFHVAASESMLRDARVAAERGADAAAVTWSATLERFGADTLNHRFSDRFKVPMTSDSWAAWLTMKILWETSLRARATTPGDIRSFLETPGAQ